MERTPATLYPRLRAASGIVTHVPDGGVLALSGFARFANQLYDFVMVCQLPPLPYIASYSTGLKIGLCVNHKPGLI